MCGDKPRVGGRERRAGGGGGGRRAVRGGGRWRQCRQAASPAMVAGPQRVSQQVGLIDGQAASPAPD